MARAGAALCVVFLVAVSASPVFAATPPPDAGAPLQIVGAGTAHGMGLAMDGVLGQAEAGWNHDRILSTFYPGTKWGRAGGIVRVLLGRGSTQRFTLPSGGRVSSESGGRGLPVDVPPGSTVTVTVADGRLVVDGVASAHSSPSPDPGPQVGPQATSTPTSSPVGPGGLLDPPPVSTPTPKPTPRPTAQPTLRPVLEPEPDKTAPPPPAPHRGPSSEGSVWIVPSGNPALTSVAATGKRYRGRMEVRRASSDELSAINHVDLETYVAGIAEEKGQGWPAEGLKTLAVAARSLARAAMTWRTNNHAAGYDICATGMCQVYLGYDGEEPAMRAATRATAGRIRTHDGRAILAMYHGNGGGQTESYSRSAGTGADPHPYLRSVKYPHAKPKLWRLDTSLSGIAQALAARKVAPKEGTMPNPLERVEVIERGHSPRVITVRLSGRGAEATVSGAAFARAMNLPSTWFSFGTEVPESITPAQIPSLDSFGSGGGIQASAPLDAEPASWPRVAAPLTVLLAVAASLVTLARPDPSKPSFAAALRLFAQARGGFARRG